MISSLQIAFLLFAFDGVAAGPSTGNTYLLVAESSMVKVLPDVPLTDGPHRETVKFAVAGGEVEAGQIVIAAGTEPLRDVEFSVSELKGPDGVVLPESAVTLSVMGYVLTKVDERIVFPYERTGWFPDPILPFVERFDVEAGKVQSLWLSVTCPAGQSAGVYRGRVTVSPANAAEQTIPVEVRVFGFDIPKERSFPFMIATFENELERLHGDAWNQDMYWRYVDFLQAHRVNMNNAYRQNEEPPTVEFVKRLVASGLDSWCLRYIRQPKTADSDSGEEIAGYDEYVTRGIEEAKAAYEVFKKAGAADLCYIYMFDEVREDLFDTLMDVAKRVREALPGVRTLTSARDPNYGTENGLSEVIDVWITPIFAFDSEEYIPKIKAARANGNRVTWYTTFWPGYPYPDFQVEHDAVGIRLLLGAMTQKYKPDGFGYWASDWWFGNDSPITKGPYTDWNPFTGVSNGDGSIICPGPDGPLTTIRFENFRDGIEDYEYYVLLEKAIAAARERGVPDARLESAEALLTVPEKLVKALNDYSRDVRLLEGHRLQIAEAIEGLSRGD